MYVLNEAWIYDEVKNVKMTIICEYYVFTCIVFSGVMYILYSSGEVDKIVLI